MATQHPLSNYADRNLQPTAATSIVDDNHPVRDVPGQFERIAAHGDLLAVTDSGVFRPPRHFRYTSLNQFGLNAGINHFQGIQRLHRGRYLVVSGGDSTEPMAHLFFIRMDSRRLRGAWGSNLLLTGSPPNDDGIMRVVALDKNLWHAGGLHLLGDILSVPLMGNGGSRVDFLHVVDPANPSLFPKSIDRPDIPAAGAVALAKLPGDGRFVCAVWREVQDADHGGRIDFYLSVRDNFLDGFQPRTKTWEFSAEGYKQKRDPKYQAITLIVPDKGDDPAGGNDGSILLYLIGTQNESGSETIFKAPLGNGANLADLYEVHLSPEMFGDNQNDEQPQIKWLDTREFHAPREYCNFDGAAGFYIDDSAKLNIYGGYHWRVANNFRFAEFRARPAADEVITDITKAWIDLYEQDDFEGRRLSILGDDEASIVDYSKIFVEDGDFDEKVSSVRYHIPKDRTYCVYQKPSFAGKTLELKGEGTVKEIADLNTAGLGNKVLSSRYI